MAAPTPTTPGSQRPFDALDAEWATLCWRHRRSTVIAHWGRQHPALASVTRLGDVIPPAGVDRRPYCQALAVLAASGDDLAARALLQLLIPGLVRLAARWRWQLDGMNAAGWEVIARAGLHIARLADTEITSSIAGWLLRSVERDLVDAPDVPAPAWPSTTPPATPRRCPGTTRRHPPRTPRSPARSCGARSLTPPAAATCPASPPASCCFTPPGTRCPSSPAGPARRGPASTACATGATHNCATGSPSPADFGPALPARLLGVRRTLASPALAHRPLGGAPAGCRTWELPTERSVT
jgi:hypothetical protein